MPEPSLTIVAGGGRGIGAATATGVRAPAVRCDDADVDALCAPAAELGRATGLVDDAGLRAHFGDLADTPVHAAAGGPGRLERVLQRVPRGRAGAPGAAAPAVAWLLGPGGGCVTGAGTGVVGGL